MQNLIKKILKESEEFDWVPELPKVIVINKGAYYPTHLEAMVELGVTGTKEFVDKYGYQFWNSPEYKTWEFNNSKKFYDSEDFLHLKIPSLAKPKNGDICFLIEKNMTQFKNRVFKLIRIEDKGEFIMNDYGFKYIN